MSRAAKGADCKSAGYAFVGSSPTSPTTLVAHDARLACRADELRPLTKHLGMSLADRACLALAERERLPVLTADRSWTSIDLAIGIRLIR